MAPIDWLGDPHPRGKDSPRETLTTAEELEEVFAWRRDVVHDLWCLSGGAAALAIEVFAIERLAWANGANVCQPTVLVRDVPR